MSDTFNLGRHEALIASLADGQHQIVESLDRMSGRLAAVETTLAEKRGERKAWIAVYGIVSGSIGSLLTFVARAKMAHA